MVCVREVAFIIDKITTKFSSKGQKKFAILRVSDGMDSYELPVWPEIYLQYQELLEEDRLIYAILVIDKRSDSLRLTCRWMTDLASVNDQVLQECENTFDKIKVQTQKTSYINSNLQKDSAIKTKPKGATSEEGTRSISPLTLSLDMDKLKHSHLCILKAILRKYPGSRALSLVFTKGHKRIASISPDTEYFVSEEISALRLELDTEGLPIRVITV